MAKEPARTGGGPPSSSWDKSETTPSTVERLTGSTLDVLYGTREMKTYPITESELSQLFGLGAVATVCFSLGAGLFGFGLDVTKDLSLSSEISMEISNFWKATRTYSFVGSVLLFVIGGIFLFLRNNNLKEIKRGVTFPKG